MFNVRGLNQPPRPNWRYEGIENTNELMEAIQRGRGRRANVSTSIGEIKELKPFGQLLQESSHQVNSTSTDTIFLI